MGGGEGLPAEGAEPAGRGVGGEVGFGEINHGGLLSGQQVRCGFERAGGGHQPPGDADLGGGVFKQRIARDGGGKSGGFRTIILFKVGGHSFFVHGFAKNEKANISPKELKALKALAATFLALDLSAIETAKSAGEIAEVTIDDEVGGQD